MALYYNNNSVSALYYNNSIVDSGYYNNNKCYNRGYTITLYNSSAERYNLTFTTYVSVTVRTYSQVMQSTITRTFRSYIASSTYVDRTGGGLKTSTYKRELTEQTSIWGTKTGWREEYGHYMITVTATTYSSYKLYSSRTSSALNSSRNIYSSITDIYKSRGIGSYSTYEPAYGNYYDGYANCYTEYFATYATISRYLTSSSFSLTNGSTYTQISESVKYSAYSGYNKSKFSRIYIAG